MTNESEYGIIKSIKGRKTLINPRGKEKPMANVVSKAIIDTDLRAQTFAKLDLSDFSKVNDQTYGILLTDQNGVERYVRLRAVVAEVKDDMTAREYMESEIAAYNEKVAAKEAKKKERAEKAKKDAEKRKKKESEAEAE